MTSGPVGSGVPPPRASVVIVNYNGGEKLLRCLESVEPTLPADVELVLVDNASTDGSAETALARFPRATLVRSPVNRGFGAGGNLGATRSRGESLVFLNPDTVVRPGWLDALRCALESGDGVGLVTSKIVQGVATPEISACGNQIHVSGLTLARGMGQPESAFPEREEVSAVSGASFAIRRDLFESLGGFDEDFFLYVEDTDLSWRARLLGKICLYEPESVVFHDYRFRLTPLKVFHQERNRYLMLFKCLRWPTLVLLLPSLLLSEIVAWGFVLIRDRVNIRNKVRAYDWVISNWELVLRKRRVVQSSRRATDRSLLRTTGYRLDFDQVSSPGLAKLVRLVFDPLFFLSRGLALALLWW